MTETQEADKVAKVQVCAWAFKNAVIGASACVDVDRHSLILSCLLFRVVDNTLVIAATDGRVLCEHVFPCLNKFDGEVSCLMRPNKIIPFIKTLDPKSDTHVTVSSKGIDLGGVFIPMTAEGAYPNYRICLDDAEYVDRSDIRLMSGYIGPISKALKVHKNRDFTAKFTKNAMILTVNQRSNLPQTRVLLMHVTVPEG